MKPKLLTTLPTYTVKLFLSDLFAGISVALVAIPLSIAIAIASGAPPEAGLVTAIVAGFLISALGGSRVQIGGPTGAFIVVAYNLESFGGRFHDDWLFALAWGSFPLLTAYFATAESIRAAAVAGAIFAFALSLAQRVLSTQVRDMRRRVRRVEGTIDRSDGSSEDITVEGIMGPAERGLRKEERWA